MIFVTVGTHEQQFDRLVEFMDDWAYDYKEEVIIQTGFSTYEPKNCKWQKMFSYQEMMEKTKEARIVVTHGGPSSFIAPIQIGKIPIVVPRKKEFDEHVNNHQVDFCKQVAERMGTIIVAEEMSDLKYVLENYDEEIKTLKKENISNNAKFCSNLERIVDDMFKGNTEL